MRRWGRQVIHRGLENWQAVPWQEVVDLWTYLRVSNIDLDAGEIEWQKVRGEQA